MARPRRAPGEEGRVKHGLPGGAWGGPLHLARQAFKRNGQNGSTMHLEISGSFSNESAVKIGDRPTDVDDNGNRKYRKVSSQQVKHATLGARQLTGRSIEVQTPWHVAFK